MAPPPVALMGPAVKEIPWQMPVVPVALPVMVIELFDPVTVKVALLANPMPAAPWPVIPCVAMMLGAEEKAAAILIPFPPDDPPTQLLNTAALDPVIEVVEPTFTAWLPVPAPPVQLVKITNPLPPAKTEVPAKLTPKFPVPEVPPVPLKLIVPEVVVRVLFMLIPYEPDPTPPVPCIMKLPVVVE